MGDRIEVGGDPIGTVRRSNTGTFAIRVHGARGAVWKTVSPVGVTGNSLSSVHNWPVIYRPGSES